MTLDIITVRREAYRADELPAVLGVSTSTAKRWIRNGTIRTVLVGGVRLIPRDEILRLLNRP